MTRHQTQSPVSFPVNVARLPQKGMPVVIDADEKQRARLAEQHGLIGVKRFHAEMLVITWKRNGVKVSGRVDAEIVQECVVTLEPLDAAIGDAFSQVYLPEESKLGRLGFHDGGEILLDADGPDSPETFTGDIIDVGALAEEFFGLAIDPYPRKQGAALGGASPDDEAPYGQLQEKLLSFTRKP